MHSKCFFLLALAFLGASAAPLASTATVGGTVGPTVSETVITPYHRTDSVATPCGRSVVRTTAIPVVPYGISSGAGFLGTAGGVYPGVIGNGFTGAVGGVYPGVVGSGFTGTGVGVYPGIAGSGLIGNGGIGYEGVIGGGVYPGVGGVAGAGILGGGLGVYAHGNLLV